jgi:hypothetical protein
MYYVQLLNVREITYMKSANWIGHILRRNFLLLQVIKGKTKGGIEVTTRCRKLLDGLKERKGYSHLKEKALDCTMRTARFGRGFRPVKRQTTKLMNETSVQQQMLSLKLPDRFNP